MTKVHVLNGLSVKVVTFEFIVRELSIFFYKTIKELIQMYHYSNNSCVLLFCQKKIFSSAQAFFTILIAYSDVFHSSHDL